MDRDEILELLRDSLSISVSKGSGDYYGNSVEVTITLNLDGKAIASDSFYMTEGAAQSSW